MHGMLDGIEPLKGNGCKGVDRELRGEHGKEPGHPATIPQLPLDSRLTKDAEARCVFARQDGQVQPHGEVSAGKITDEESRDIHLGVGEEDDEDDSGVTDDSEEKDEPDADA